jgi:hypothetical protein
VLVNTLDPIIAPSPVFYPTESLTVNQMFITFTINKQIVIKGKPGATVPDSWPSDLSTRINAAHPLDVTRPRLSAYLSSSPPSFCPAGREEDAAAIIGIIDAAERFVRVAVMDYFPATIYGGNRTRFWPLIDNAIRRGEQLLPFSNMPFLLIIIQVRYIFFSFCIVNIHMHLHSF